MSIDVFKIPVKSVFVMGFQKFCLLKKTDESLFFDVDGEVFITGPLYANYQTFCEKVSQLVKNSRPKYWDRLAGEYPSTLENDLGDLIELSITPA